MANPLDNPLVVKCLLGFTPLADVKELRQVSRTWHLEGTRHLQKRGPPVTIRLPYNISTLQLFKLIESSQALRNEEEDSAEWPWPFVKIKLICRHYEDFEQSDLEDLLDSISVYVGQLSIDISFVDDWIAPPSTDMITFPRLTHFSCSARTEGQEGWAMMVSKSPLLRHLKMNLLTCDDVDDGWPLLDKLTEVEQLRLDSLEISTRFWPIYEHANVSSVVGFVTRQKDHLQSLTLMCKPVRNSEDENADVLSSLRFTKLTTLKGNTEDLAYFFGPPQNLPRVKSLVLCVGEDVLTWLAQWRGQPVSSVEELFIPNLVPRFSPYWHFDGELLLSALAPVFPNVKVLRLSEETTVTITTPRWIEALEPYLVKWVPESNGGVPDSGAFVGDRYGGEPMYVIRAGHARGMVPGKLCDGRAHISYGCYQVEKRSYEVLVCPPTANVSWGSDRDGKVPDNAIVAGKDPNGEIYYVGRATISGRKIVGKIHPSHGVCYVPHGGRELNSRQYEVLVQNV